MLRRWFNGIAVVSAVLLALSLGLATSASLLDPYKHFLSLGNSFHVGMHGRFAEEWVGHIVFFNDPVLGPCAGTSTTIMGKDDPPPVTPLSWRAGDSVIVSKVFFDPDGEVKVKLTDCQFPGIYFRHLVFRGNAILWTGMVSLWFPLIFFGLLPALWGVLRLRDRWRCGPKGKGVRSPIR